MSKFPDRPFRHHRLNPAALDGRNSSGVSALLTDGFSVPGSGPGPVGAPYSLREEEK